MSASNWRGVMPGASAYSPACSLPATCICSASSRQYHGLAVVRPCCRNSATMPLKLVPRLTSMLCCRDDMFNAVTLKRW